MTGDRHAADAFLMAVHDARDDGVYLVEVWDDTGGYRHGIFTTSALARTWMETLPASWRMACAPFILDMPEHGNVPVKEQH